MTDVRAVHNRHAAQTRALANTGRAGATDGAATNADASGGEFAGLFGQIADAAASATPGKPVAASPLAGDPAVKLPVDGLDTKATGAVAIAADGAPPVPVDPQLAADQAKPVTDMPAPAPVCTVINAKIANIKNGAKPATDDVTAATELADAAPIATEQDEDTPALDAPRKPRKGEDKADPTAAQPDQAPPAVPAPPVMVLAPPPIAQPVVPTTTTQPSAAAIAAVAAPVAVAATTPAVAVAATTPAAAVAAATPAAAQPVVAPAQEPVDQPAAEAAAQVAAVTIDPAASRKAPTKTARDRANDDQTAKPGTLMTSAEKREAAAASAAVQSPLADDASKPHEGAFQLSDFVQSLPPVLQAQLGDQSIAPASAAGSGGTPTASTADQLGDQVIDMGVSGQWIDRMAREIAGLADGSGHSRFQLSPPHLGRIQVDLWQSESGTNLRMTTETDEAAKRLRDGQSSLANDARVAALSLSSVTVEKTSAPFDSGREQQGQRQPSDFMGQAQQQAAGQGQNQSQGSNQSGGLNRTATAAVIGRDQDIRSVTTDSASTVDGRRVRYA